MKVLDLHAGADIGHGGVEEKDHGGDSGQGRREGDSVGGSDWDAFWASLKQTQAAVDIVDNNFVALQRFEDAVNHGD